MSRQLELTAEFRGEKVAFENGDDSRVIIGEAIRDNGDEITIKGEAALNALRRGLTYRFYGHWYEHHKYGKQFVFSAFILEEPATKGAVITYVQQCRGIGPKAAERLWNRFDSDAIKTLRVCPELVAEECGIREDVAEEAAAKLKSMMRTERAKAELMALLDGRGFPKATVDRCLQTFGSAASAIVKRNPYILMHFRGCGFLKTDKMYLELGHRPDRLKRQALCAWHAIARDSDGHTWFPASVASGAISRTISGAAMNPERAAELAVRAKMLTRRIDEHGCVWIAEAAKAGAEERIVNAIESAMLELEHA